MFLLIGIIIEMVLDVLKKPKEFRVVILYGFKVVCAIIKHGKSSRRVNLETIDRTALRTINTSQHVIVDSFPPSCG